MKHLGIISIGLLLFVITVTYAGDRRKRKQDSPIQLYSERDPWYGLKGRLLLNAAIKDGFVWQVAMLLDNSDLSIGDINAKDPNGATPADLAIKFGKNDILELLVQKGACDPRSSALEPLKK